MIKNKKKIMKIEFQINKIYEELFQKINETKKDFVESISYMSYFNDCEYYNNYFYDVKLNDIKYFLEEIIKLYKKIIEESDFFLLLKLKKTTKKYIFEIKYDIFHIYDDINNMRNLEKYNIIK